MHTCNISRREIKEIGGNNDDDGIASLNCDDLRDICRTHGSPHTGTKYVLLLRLMIFLEALSTVDADNDNVD